MRLSSQKNVADGRMEVANTKIINVEGMAARVDFMIRWNVRAFGRD
jgi:hypothetical protein